MQLKSFMNVHIVHLQFGFERIENNFPDKHCIVKYSDLVRIKLQFHVCLSKTYFGVWLAMINIKTMKNVAES